MIGTQRSGSNLLRLMLAQLPGMFAPPSAHILKELDPVLKLNAQVGLQQLVLYAARLVDCNVLKWPQGAPSANDILRNCQGISPEHVFCAVYDSGAKLSGAANWLCKCLEHVHHIDRIQMAIPALNVIHIIRDPRDVALSFAEIPVGPKEPRVIALSWVADQEAALKFRALTPQDRWIEVRYESLINDPSFELRRICDKFGLTFVADALDYYRRIIIAGKMLSRLRSCRHCG